MDLLGEHGTTRNFLETWFINLQEILIHALLITIFNLYIVLYYSSRNHSKDRMMSHCIK